LNINKKEREQNINIRDEVIKIKVGAEISDRRRTKD